MVGLCAVVACSGDDDDDLVAQTDAAVAIDAPAPAVDTGRADADPFACYEQARSARLASTPGTLIARVAFPRSDRGENRPTSGPTPDAAAGPPCNPISQTGCAVGEKCAFILDDPGAGAGHVGCVPDGTQGLGEACTDATVAGESDDCTIGSDCYRGVCHEICATVIGCIEGTCTSFQDGNGNPIPIEICLPSCDLLLQDCAGDGEGCYLAGEPVCVGAGTAGIGEPCAAANGCEPGMVCVGSDMGGFFCRSFCGPWMNCFDGTGAVTSCGCGSCRACNANEVCFAIGDGMGGAASATAGVCLPDADADCDCNATPICPPAM